MAAEETLRVQWRLLWVWTWDSAGPPFERAVDPECINMTEPIEIWAAAPLAELWAEYKVTTPIDSLDPVTEVQIRDGFFAGAAAMLALVAVEGTPAQREASLNAAQVELQRWAAGG